MTPETQTPETDANEEGWRYWHQYGFHDSLAEADPIGWPDFARKLETQRDEARRKQAAINGCRNQMANAFNAQDAEAFWEADRRCNSLVEEWIPEHAQVLAQRDEARRERDAAIDREKKVIAWANRAVEDVKSHIDETHSDRDKWQKVAIKMRDALNEVLPIFVGKFLTSGEHAAVKYAREEVERFEEAGK